MSIKHKPRFLAFLFVLLLAACGQAGQTEAETGEIIIYRVRTGDQVFRGGLIDRESIAAADLPAETEMITSLLNKSAATSGFVNCLPPDVKILSVDITGGAASVTMSENFSELTEFEKTTANCCIALTLCELENVNSVTILSGDKVFCEALTPDGILLYDTETVPFEKRLRLYFPVVSSDLLRIEYHTLTVDADAPLEVYIIEELIRGPYNGELRQAMPAGTELLGITVEDGLCTVDLSSPFTDNESPDAAAARLTVYSIVNSLTSLKEITSVLILSEGRQISYYGSLNMTAPLERNDNLAERTT